jgi:hypothetical protein
MSATHVVLAAAIGGAIGAVTVLGLSWTRRLLAAGGYRVFAISWPLKLAIVLAATAIYMLIGADNAPLPVVAESAPPENPGAADAGPAPIDAGAVTLSFRPPAGYCLYPAPLLEAVKLQQRRINPDNTIHTVFGDCGELQDAAATGARIRNFGILMTPTSLIGKAMDHDALDRMVAQSLDPVGMKATLDQRMAQAKTRLSMSSLSALGILDGDANASYFGYLAQAQLGGEVFDQAYVMALTVVGGRLISYSLYADYVKDPRPVLFGLVNQLKLAIADFVQRN